MAKIIPINAHKKHRRGSFSPGIQSKESLIRGFLRLFRKALALSLTSSDECDDLK